MRFCAFTESWEIKHNDRIFFWCYLRYTSIKSPLNKPINSRAFQPTIWECEIQQKLNETQKHHRKAVDVHSNDAENDRSSCCIFSLRQQQIQTEFAFCETKLSLHFNSVGIILIGDLFLSLAVHILLRPSKFLAGKPDAEIAAIRNVCTIAVNLINENALRIMPGAPLIICNRCFQNSTLIVGIKGELLNSAHFAFIHR